LNGLHINDIHTSVYCLPRMADMAVSNSSIQCPVTLLDFGADEPSRERWDSIITASVAKNINCA